jgi:uncharacterized membrane protein (DUF2068 family)
VIAARGAAVLYGLLGVGFGIGTAVTLALLARNGELPMTPWGFRSLDGPLARIDTRTTMLAGTALIAVCAADVATAAGLWRGRRWAGRLGLATTPAAVFLGLGFELPILLAAIPLRVGLVLAAWRRLT